jgi:cytidylate kinase
VSSREIFSVAIDGPAGAGKSSVARAVAAGTGLRYVDTGAMYRAAAWSALQKGIAPTDVRRAAGVARRLRLRFTGGARGTRIWAGRRDVTDLIRTQEVSQAASQIAVIPAVRRVLQGLQRKIGRSGGVVMEGRDIGTVVLPDARFKFYLDASPLERARRRYREMKARGDRVNLRVLARAIALRDRRDKGRRDSPLRPAGDAVVIDTTPMTRDQVVERVIGRIRRAAP